MKKIIILDFASAEVHVFDYDKNIFEDGEDFIAQINEEGYSFSDINCQWMISETMNIQIH